MDNMEQFLLHRIYRYLETITLSQGAIMSQLDDLQAADDNLQTEVAAIISEVTDLESKIANTVSQLSPEDQTRLASMIDDINATTGRIKTALTPPAADEPAPVVVDTPPADAPPADAPPADAPAEVPTA